MAPLPPAFGPSCRLDEIPARDWENAARAGVRCPWWCLLDRVVWRINLTGIVRCACGIVRLLSSDERDVRHRIAKDSGTRSEPALEGVQGLLLTQVIYSPQASGSAG